RRRRGEPVEGRGGGDDRSRPPRPHRERQRAASDVSDDTVDTRGRGPGAVDPTGPLCVRVVPVGTPARCARGGGDEGHHARARAAITHCWCGLVGVTRSLRPLIGRLPIQGEVLHALAYAGHGLAAASLAGRLLAELFLGESSPELEYALTA